MITSTDPLAAGPLVAANHLALWERVPESLRVSVIEMHERPWNEVIYVYSYVGQRRLDLGELPAPMATSWCGGCGRCTRSANASPRSG
jgi:hypothetical protein